MTWVEMKAQIHTGDVLAYSQYSWWDRLIQWWTRSAYSHVAMFYWDDARLLVVQATPDHGVGVELADRALSEGRGELFWVSLKVQACLAKNPRYQLDVVDYCYAHLGDDYDWHGIAHFVLPFIKQQKSREFCSELIASAFKEAKLLDQTFLSPGELVSQPIFNTEVRVTC